MYKNLFKMCGFNKDEINEHKPRIEKVLDRIGVLNKEGIRHAEERTRVNFDTEMNGTRKFLRLMMLEFFDAVLAREENDKVVFANMPMAAGIAQSMQESVLSKDASVYVGSALSKSWIVLGSIFDKVNELIEVGEDMGMTAGRAHCSHYHILGGLYEKGILPIPDLCVSASMYCDQAAETDTLLAGQFGYPVAYVDCTNDWAWGSWPEFEDDRGIKYVRGKLIEAFGVFKETTGVEVGQDDLGKSLKHNGKVTAAWQNIVQLMARTDPQPVSQADLSLCFHNWSVAGIYEPMQIDAYNTMMKDVHTRSKQGVAVVPKGAPRVYMQLRTSVDMTPMKAVEESGLAIPVMMFDMVTDRMLTPGKVRDPLTITSEFLYKVPQFSDVPGLIDYMEEVCKFAGVDGCLHIFQFNCRPWAVSPLMAKRELKKRLDVPILVVEGDIYDTRNYSAGQLKTRIESFAEVLKAKKLEKAA